MARMGMQRAWALSWRGGYMRRAHPHKWGMRDDQDRRVHRADND